MISTETSDDHNNKKPTLQKVTKNLDMKIQKIQDSQHNFKTAFFGGNSTQ